MSTKLGHQARSTIGKGDRGGSGKTAKEHRQRAEKIGDFMASQGLQKIDDMKLKHCERYMDSLEQRGLGESARANHASTLRMVADAIGKGDMIPASNKEAFGFENRAGTARFNPVDVDREAVQKVTENLQSKGYAGDALAYEMTQAFGLRRAEALKSNQTVEIDGKTYLVVEFAKGAKERGVPVETAYQKDVLSRVQAHVAEKAERSLVPDNQTWKQGLQNYSNHVHRAGGTKADNCHSHANRHGWIQDLRAAGVSIPEIDKVTGHNPGRGIYRHYSN